jgi:UDP-N-acetylglucosamine--N-acetylmuramyl-(pentapeptide) pyrophosphoryl-undecaprenol N-acetylglucosamine transferase
MRVIISAGGTGGHLYPAIATADALASLDKKTEILFITGISALERELVAKAGYTASTLDVPSIRRRLSSDFFTGIYKSSRGLSKATKAVKDFDADAVAGFGGAVTYAVVRAAKKLGLPAVIQEQNMAPGLANRQLSRTADIVAVSWKEAGVSFPRGANVVVTGNPVRTNGLDTPVPEARAALDLPEKGFVVTVFGGSQGARHVNEVITASYGRLNDIDGLTLLHITGTRDYDETVKAWSAAGAPDRVKMLPYLDGMGQAYRASDLMVCRAGASTLAELAVFGIPSILVPYPYASSDHQTKNAEIFTMAGAAEIIADEALDADSLTAAVAKLAGDKDKLKKMSDAAKGLGRPNAARDLAALILNIAKKRADKVE